jgi:hypothetical protein
VRNWFVFAALAASLQANIMLASATCEVYRSTRSTQSKELVASSSGDAGCNASFGRATAYVGVDPSNIIAFVDWSGDYGDEEFYTASFEFSSTFEIERQTIFNPRVARISYEGPEWTISTGSDFSLEYVRPEVGISYSETVVPGVPFSIYVEARGGPFESSIGYAYGMYALSDGGGSGITAYDVDGNVIPREEWDSVTSDVPTPEPLSLSLTATGLAFLWLRRRTNIISAKRAHRPARTPAWSAQDSRKSYPAA